jgi:hypothetical protein
MNWITEHWLEILAFVGAFDIMLGVISKWTPWKWDDSVYTVLHSIFDKFFRSKT